MAVRLDPTGLTVHGEVWDDESRDNLTHICVSHGERINFVQFVYAENGNLVKAEEHGGNPGPYCNVEMLDYPSEFLTGLSGCYCYYDEIVDGQPRTLRAVSSIKFTTNKGSYGPYGCSQDKDRYVDPIEDKENRRAYLRNTGRPMPPRGDVRRPDFDYKLGKTNTFAGFHGTASNYLHSIGVLSKPTAGDGENNTVAREQNEDWLRMTGPRRYFGDYNELVA